MIYTKTFRLSDFEWIGNAKRVVEMICNAGKSSEFVHLIEKRFDHENDTAADFEISKWVIDEVVSIMGSLGLTLDGKPVKKKFKVFYRITGVSYEEVEADNAEEAREKLLEEFGEGDPLYCINRDDIETVVPVAYEEGDDGVTKDYGPSEEIRKEIDNALCGIDLCTLTRIEVCGDGEIVRDPSVKLFDSYEKARLEMCRQHEQEESAKSKCNDLGDVLEPKYDSDRCYVSGKDNYTITWTIEKASLER